MRTLHFLIALLLAGPGYARIENFNELIKNQSEEVRKNAAELRGPREEQPDVLPLVRPESLEVVAPGAELPAPQLPPAVSDEKSQFTQIGQELNDARVF